MAIRHGPPSTLYGRNQHIVDPFTITEEMLSAPVQTKLNATGGTPGAPTGNLDGGTAGTVYGGISNLNAGSV